MKFFQAEVEEFDVQPAAPGSVLPSQLAGFTAATLETAVLDMVRACLLLFLFFLVYRKYSADASHAIIKRWDFESERMAPDN